MKLRKWIHLIKGILRYLIQGGSIYNLRMLVVDDDGFLTTWDTIWLD